MTWARVREAFVTMVLFAGGAIVVAMVTLLWWRHCSGCL